MALESINPATGEKIRTYPEMSEAEIERILQKADQAFHVWRETDLQNRSIQMKQAAHVLRKNKESYARLIAQEMGKPLVQGISEVEKCAWVCDFYADEARSYLEPEMVSTDAQKSFIIFEPLGVLLAVMPWNFPFYQVFRCAAPALMAGNALILKHAPNVSGCALAIEEVFKAVDFPEGLFRTVLVEVKAIAKMIEHSSIKAVTLTGSPRAGKAVASKAGEMLKKTVLELGGSDPYIILEDADLEAAAETCAASRLINGGQSCIAAKRFIVIQSIQKEFEKKFVERMKSYRMGDPFSEGVTVGPLARQDLRDTLHDQVKRSVEKGAKLLLGGEIPQMRGAFYPPTVLTNVKSGMPAYDEETFGPVAAIIAVADEKEAIRVANASPYGLGAAVFTRDIKRGERIASQEIEAGSCFVNAFVKSDPRLPFGGIKQSGYGRELSSFGIHEFVTIKSVYVK
jgi:succinate-semialdehyde dehydrogenase/glutarate-semialdehyde dehydrogenase